MWNLFINFVAKSETLFPFSVVYLTCHKSPCCVVVLGEFNYTISKRFMPFLWVKVLIFQGSSHQTVWEV